MTAFVVDDSKLARASLNKILKEHFPQLTLKEASNGQEVLDLLKFTTPNVIFLDLTMPVMSGYELMEVLHKEYPDIDVYVVTADIQKSAQERISALGARGYIKKPVSVEKLREIMESIKATLA